MLVVVIVVLVKVVVVDVFVVALEVFVVLVLVVLVLVTSCVVALISVVFAGSSFFSGIHVVETSDSWKGSSPGFLVRLMGRIGSSVVVKLVVAACFIANRHHILT